MCLFIYASLIFGIYISIKKSNKNIKNLIWDILLKFIYLYSFGFLLSEVYSFLEIYGYFNSVAGVLIPALCKFESLFKFSFSEDNSINSVNSINSFNTNKAIYNINPVYDNPLHYFVLKNSEVTWSGTWLSSGYIEAIVGYLKVILDIIASDILNFKDSMFSTTEPILPIEIVSTSERFDPEVDPESSEEGKEISSSKKVNSQTGEGKDMPTPENLNLGIDKLFYAIGVEFSRYNSLMKTENGIRWEDLFFWLKNSLLIPEEKIEKLSTLLEIKDYNEFYRSMPRFLKYNENFLDYYICNGKVYLSEETFNYYFESDDIIRDFNLDKSNFIIVPNVKANISNYTGNTCLTLFIDEILIPTIHQSGEQMINMHIELKDVIKSSILKGLNH